MTNKDPNTNLGKEFKLFESILDTKEKMLSDIVSRVGYNKHKEMKDSLDAEIEDMRAKQKLLTALINIGVIIVILFFAYYIVMNRNEPSTRIINVVPEQAASNSDKPNNFDSIADAMKD